MTEFLLAPPVVQLFNFVLGSSWAACLIVPEILILQRLFKAKFSARWHCFLWFILIAQLAVPWLPQFPLSVTSRIPSPGIDVAAFTGGAVSVGEAVAPSEAVDSIRALSPVTNDAAISTLNIVVAIWFLVACLILLHIAYLAIRTRRRLQTAQAVTDPRTIQLLQSSIERMGVRRSVALATHETTDFTAVYGTVAPKIVMPESLLQSLSNDELSQIFLHELAHVKRNDIPVAWLASILQALHWFNPLVWYGFHRMRLDREIACDALALSHMNPSESTSYGDTLFKLMENPVYPPALPGVVEIAGNRSQLRRRIDMISTNRISPYRLGFTGSAVLAAAAMVLLVSNTARGHDEPKDKEYPHAIPIEMYSKPWGEFAPGDSVTIEEVRGTSERFEVGGSYRVRGRFTLKSRESAKLHAYATNGEVESQQGPNVSKGGGEFIREFTIKKTGMYHVDFYPSEGGSGFGGTYYRPRRPEIGPEGSTVDLAISDADFTIRPYPDGGLHSMVIRIRNQGNQVSSRFPIYFYKGDPNTTKPLTHGGGPIEPSDEWSEMTMPFELAEGMNTYYVKIDPDNAVAESDETNNTAKMVLNVRKVVVDRIEL